MKMPKLSKPVAILLIITIILLTATIAAAIFALTLPSSGTINTPASITPDPTHLDWGTLNQGQVVDRYVTLTNNGDLPTQPLSVSAFPTIGALVHNATGKVIAAHSSIIVDFRLTVDAMAAPGNFNFDITISG
jgi:hypothetical protein